MFDLYQDDIEDIIATDGLFGKYTNDQIKARQRELQLKVDNLYHLVKSNEQCFNAQLLTEWDNFRREFYAYLTEHKDDWVGDDDLLDSFITRVNSWVEKLKTNCQAIQQSGVSQVNAPTIVPEDPNIKNVDAIITKVLIGVGIIAAGIIGYKIYKVMK